jgi:hypothetical protein
LDIRITGITATITMAAIITGAIMEDTTMVIGIMADGKNGRDLGLGKAS